MKVRVLLPFGRTWAWHRTLVEALAERFEVEVHRAPSPPYPLALRAWLALERRLFGPRGLAVPLGREADAFSPAGARLRSGPPSTVPAASDADLVLNLTEQGPGVSLRYDDRREEAALFGALQARRSPRLEVVDGEGRVLAASQPAIEVRDELGRSLSYVHARLVTLLLRAADGGVSPAVPPPLAETTTAASLPAFVGHGLGTKLSAKLSRGRSVQEHWRIALRRTPTFDSDAPPTTTGFVVEPGPTDAFHADPFLFAHGGETFLFVEAYPWATRKGVIACARLDAEGRAGAFETVLEAAHHLSYPQVFAHEGEIYMLPETAAVRRLELYRAVDFPHRWELTAVMLEGRRIADATLLAHEGRWWLFASLAEHGGASQDELFAWHAPSPFGPWTAHALNPLISDVRAGRPAGRFVRRGARLYRPAQDSAAGYGAGLAWMEVLELTPETYDEREAARWRGADFGAYTGVHTFSEAGGYEAVDLKAGR